MPVKLNQLIPLGPCAACIVASSCSSDSGRGISIEEVFQRHRAGRLPCQTIVVVTGINDGPDPWAPFDIGEAVPGWQHPYHLSSGSRSDISVVMDGVNAPPRGPTLLVKGRLNCLPLIKLDGQQPTESLGLIEIDRRVDIPPGSATFSSSWAG